MNFRKDKVSKAAAFAALVLVSSLLAPAPYRDPEALVLQAATAGPAPARLESRCAPATRELRFEMISDESEAHPPPSRRPMVCLAVHGLPAGDPER